MYCSFGAGLTLSGAFFFAHKVWPFFARNNNNHIIAALIQRPAILDGAKQNELLAGEAIAKFNVIFGYIGDNALR